MVVGLGVALQGHTPYNILISDRGAWVPSCWPYTGRRLLTSAVTDAKMTSKTDKFNELNDLNETKWRLGKYTCLYSNSSYSKAINYYPYL
ncbi:hypothetical protein EVAR_26760_1 [Eumeta japonica]|uniref:Uncharacterized protein n=1 Tax=Eumeta variegata TaxID=151549 RepID=A0A4C1XD30_EUMVA|nr:hypothetical protein EVAR_26760_1 [Eumeta japonica]